MIIYLVIMYRWGDLDAHSYVEGIYSTYELAKENAEKNNAEISFIKGDILYTLTLEYLNTLTLDIIISNPPYITEAEKSTMQKFPLSSAASQSQRFRLQLRTSTS